MCGEKYFKTPVNPFNNTWVFLEQPSISGICDVRNNKGDMAQRAESNSTDKLPWTSPGSFGRKKGINRQIISNCYHKHTIFISFIYIVSSLFFPSPQLPAGVRRQDNNFWLPVLVDRLQLYTRTPPRAANGLPNQWVQLVLLWAQTQGLGCWVQEISWLLLPFSANTTRNCRWALKKKVYKTEITCNIRSWAGALY